MFCRVCRAWVGAVVRAPHSTCSDSWTLDDLVLRLSSVARPLVLQNELLQQFMID